MLVIGGVVFRKAGIPLVLPVAVPLAHHVKAESVARLDGEAEDLVCRRQSVLDADESLVGAVLDVARCADRALRQTLREKHGLIEHIRLIVRRDVDAVVVGHQETKLDGGDIRRLGADASRFVLRAGELVAQGDRLTTIGSAETFALETTLHDRFVLKNGALAAVFLLQAATVGYFVALVVGDDHFFEKEGGAADEILGRVVAQADLHFGDVRVLCLCEGAQHRVALERLTTCARVEGVYVSGAHLDEVTDLRRRPAADQVRHVRLLIRLGTGAAKAAGPGGDDGGLVLVGGQVDLNAVEQRLGERQRGEGRADLVAHRDRRMILAL